MRGWVLFLGAVLSFGTLACTPIKGPDQEESDTEITRAFLKDFAGVYVHSSGSGFEATENGGFSFRGPLFFTNLVPKKENDDVCWVEGFGKLEEVAYRTTHHREKFLPSATHILKVVWFHHQLVSRPGRTDLCSSVTPPVGEVAALYLAVRHDDVRSLQFFPQKQTSASGGEDGDTSLVMTESSILNLF